MGSSAPPGHWARLNSALETQLLSISPDLWLVSSEGYSLPTYASLLTLHSPLLKDILSSNNSSTSLSLPVPALPLGLLLSLLAQGSVSHKVPFNPLEVFFFIMSNNLSNEHWFQQVLEAAELLGI